MNKFNVGDRVVCSPASYNNREGTKGTVVEIPAGSFVKVLLEDGTMYCDVEICFLFQGEDK